MPYSSLYSYDSYDAYDSYENSPATKANNKNICYIIDNKRGEVWPEYTLSLSLHDFNTMSTKKLDERVIVGRGNYLDAKKHLEELAEMYEKKGLCRLEK